jgi:hypothetical protein
MQINNNEGNKNDLKRTWLQWVPVVALMVIAALLRLKLTSPPDYYLLEGDGPYYPLQARGLLQNFNLPLRDVPITFLIEAFLAKILQVLNVGSNEECILLAVRISDAFLPPLAAIPIFLISAELRGQSRTKLQDYLMVAFALLNFSPVFIFSQALHKNAIGVFWIFYYLYFTFRYLKYSNQKDLYKILLVLFLCALTHFGSFVVLVVFTLVFGAIRKLNVRKALKAINYKRTAIMATIFVGCGFLIALFDQNRFNRLVQIPFKLFEAPVILYLTDGQDIAGITNILTLMLMTLLSVIGLVMFVRHRKNMNQPVKTFAIGLLIASLFLTSLLLGVEWANRMYIVSFIPITILYLILLDVVRSKIFKAIPILIFTGLIFISVIMAINQPGFQTLTNDELVEFKSIKHKVKFSKDAAIIGRKDLRLLASWFFNTKGAADYVLSRKDLELYDTLYLLRQIKGSNFPKDRQKGEAEIPDNSNCVFCGNYFEIHKLSKGMSWDFGEGVPPKVCGTIVSIKDKTIRVFTGWTNSSREIRISGSTKIHMLNNSTSLKEGIYIEVWGRGKPFSLAVEADIINEKTGKNNY